jgi:DNA-binding XRE family transcriptional regulator
MISAEQIKKAREKLGERHGQFAKRFGVARTTIIHWENGNPPTFEPTVRHVEAVLAELGFVYAKRKSVRAQLAE